jgi:hypothetical protein
MDRQEELPVSPLRLALELGLPLADGWSSPDYRGTCKKFFLFLPRSQEHITESLKKNVILRIHCCELEHIIEDFKQKIITRIVVASYKKYYIH